MKCITAHLKYWAMPTDLPFGDPPFLLIKLYYFFETAASTMSSIHVPHTKHAKSWVLLYIEMRRDSKGSQSLEIVLEITSTLFWDLAAESPWYSGDSLREMIAVIFISEISSNLVDCYGPDVLSSRNSARNLWVFLVERTLVSFSRTAKSMSSC